MQRVGGVTVATTDLEEQDVQEYYNGYANRTLWPLFHYRIDLTAYERSYGSGYERVNARFADTLLPLIEPDDIIWVQDYHLIPLGRELRERGVKNPIGFFLHIPWPARELIATLPKHRELVEAMFHYDLVGFHTKEWRDAFMSYVLYEEGGESLPDGRLRAFDRTVRAEAFPIGIEAQSFTNMLKTESGITSYARMQESKAGRKMIIGVDRLDYSKGIEERFLAYERFLQENSDQQSKVFLLQVSTHSRGEVPEYQEIATRLDGLSGRINGEFAEMDWVPIRNVHRMHSREELAGLYRAAEVGLVTPLRDGMNLVAKEYVAAQDEADPGVLILSRFAGAAVQLKEALIVNPFSQEDMAEAIKRALSMSVAERRRRWIKLMDNVEKEDVTAWRDAFVRCLKSTRDDILRPKSPVPIRVV
jgi:trehalose 6-phosphate synthase